MLVGLGYVSFFFLRLEVSEIIVWIYGWEILWKVFGGYRCRESN